MRCRLHPALVSRLVVAAGTLLLAGCDSTSSPEPYTDEAGNYRIVMPGKLKHAQQTLPSPAGPLTMVTLESEDSDRTARLVAYIDYPMQIVQASDPDTMLDGGVRGAGSAWSVKTQQPITLNGHAGRELRFEVNGTSDGDLKGMARFYLVGNRLYQAVIVGPAPRVSNDEMRKFVESFQLLKEVPPLARATPSAPRVETPKQPDHRIIMRPGSLPAPGAARPSPSGPPPAPNMAVQGGDAGPDPSQPAEVPIELTRAPGTLLARPDPGANEHERFREVAPEGGVLVGMRVGYINAFGGPKVAAVQPIFQVGGTYVEGKHHGKDIPLTMRVVARPGYAVSGVNTHTGLLLDAFQLIFMKFQDGALDPADTYTSDWLGDPRGGGPGTASGEGKPVVGIHGRSTGREINALGIVVAQ